MMGFIGLWAAVILASGVGSALDPLATIGVPRVIMIVTGAGGLGFVLGKIADGVSND